jgi:hypothetical protein
VSAETSVKGRSFGAASRAVKRVASHAEQRVDEAFVARGRYALKELHEIAPLVGLTKGGVWAVEQRALRKIVDVALRHPDEFPCVARMARNQQARLRLSARDDRQDASQGAGRGRRASSSNSHTECANTPDLSPRSLTSPGHRPNSGPGARSTKDRSGLEGKR